MLSRSAFEKWFSENSSSIIAQLFEYLRVDTSDGKEKDAYECLGKILTQYGFEYFREPYHEALEGHSLATYPVNPHGVNLRSVYSKGKNNQRKILFNCHVDVVPQSKFSDNQFEPYCDSDKVYARGACDTKSNVFLLLGAIKFLEESGDEIGCNVLLDLVSDEETGGNGTLSTILHGVDADLVVVFEPTNLDVHNGHRGCLTTALEIQGKSVHMGSDLTGVSAIKCAIDIIKHLESLEEEMLKEASRDESFNHWKRPLQINIGKINGGEWPGTVAEKCSLVFNTGFLPPSSIESIENRIRDHLQVVIDNYPGIHVNFNFHVGLRNQAYLSSVDNTLIAYLMNIKASLNKNTPSVLSSGWRVSCDARHYANFAEIPTVIFGAGSLADAHSAVECVSIYELKKGMFLLANFLSANDKSVCNGGLF